MSFLYNQRFIRSCQVAIFARNQFLYPKPVSLVVVWNIIENIDIDGVVILDEQECAVWKNFSWVTLKPGDVFTIDLSRLSFDHYSLEELLKEPEESKIFDWSKEGF